MFEGLLANGFFRLELLACGLNPVTVLEKGLMFVLFSMFCEEIADVLGLDPNT